MLHFIYRLDEFVHRRHRHRQNLVAEGLLLGHEGSDPTTLMNPGGAESDTEQASSPDAMIFESLNPRALRRRLLIWKLWQMISDSG